MRARAEARLLRRAGHDLRPGEETLVAIRATVPPSWAASGFDQNGVWIHTISKDTGMALGMGNELVLTSERILNDRSGFFGRIGHLRGELPLTRITEARSRGRLGTGRVVTFTLRDAKALTLVVRGHDDLDGFLDALRPRLQPEPG